MRHLGIDYVLKLLVGDQKVLWLNGDGEILQSSVPERTTKKQTTKRWILVDGNIAISIQKSGSHRSYRR